MSGYRFRLHSIMRLRERERDRAAQSLQQAMLAKQKLHDQIVEIENESQQQVATRSQASTGLVDIQRLIDAQRYQLTLRESILGLQANIDLVAGEIEKRRARLVLCEQDVKALEKLEESGREAWAAEQASRSQSRLDEFASFHHFLRHNSSGSLGRDAISDPPLPTPFSTES